MSHWYGRPFWYDIDGNPIDLDEAERLLGDMDARRIGSDDIRDCWVSTAHVVLDHGLIGGDRNAPLIFETAVFHPGRDGEIVWCARTATRHAALAMHDQVCAALRDDDLVGLDELRSRL